MFIKQERNGSWCPAAPSNTCLLALFLLSVVLSCLSVAVLSTLILVKSVNVADISGLARGASNVDNARHPAPLSWKHQSQRLFRTQPRVRHHELSDGVLEVKDEADGSEDDAGGGFDEQQARWALGSVTVEQAIIFVYGLIVREYDIPPK
jgi:hypothetical protein